MNSPVIGTYIHTLNDVILAEKLDSEDVFMQVEYFVSEIKERLDEDPSNIDFLGGHLQNDFIIELALLYVYKTITLRDIRSILTMGSGYIEKLHQKTYLDSIDDGGNCILQRLSEEPTLDGDFTLEGKISDCGEVSIISSNFGCKQDLLHYLDSLYEKYYFKNGIIEMHLVMVEERGKNLCLIPYSGLTPDLVFYHHGHEILSLGENLEMLNDMLGNMDSGSFEEGDVFEGFLQLDGKLLKLSLNNDDIGRILCSELIELSLTHKNGLGSYLKDQYSLYDWINESSLQKYANEHPGEIFIFGNTDFKKYFTKKYSKGKK